MRGLRGPSGQVNQALDLLGCQAEVISLDPSSLEEVLDGVLQVGTAAGAQQRAHEVLAGLRERLARVQAAVVEGLERPRGFALEWGDPPFCGGHWIPGDAAGRRGQSRPRLPGLAVGAGDLGADRGGGAPRLGPRPHQ